MSWLRIDDGFTANGKIGQLSDSEFRCWIRLLCHCAKSNDPSVDAVAIREVAGLTGTRVRKYAALELLDSIGDSYEIHDWEKYLPKDSATERQAKWRARRRAEGDPLETTSGEWRRTRQAVFERDNGVCIDCRVVHPQWAADHEPHRDDLRETGLSVYDIQYIVTRCPSCHAKKTRREATERKRRLSDSGVTPGVTAQVTAVPTRAGARADSRPVPSCESEKLSTAAVPPRAPDLLWEALVTAMGRSPETTAERKKWNAALKDLRVTGATPEDILARAKAYRQEWPEMECTPFGLASHWSRFNGKGQASPTTLRLAELNAREAA